MRMVMGSMKNGWDDSDSTPEQSARPAASSSSVIGMTINDIQIYHQTADGVGPDIVRRARKDLFLPPAARKAEIDMSANICDLESGGRARSHRRVSPGKLRPG